MKYVFVYCKYCVSLFEFERIKGVFSNQTSNEKSNIDIFVNRNDPESDLKVEKDRHERRNQPNNSAITARIK